MTRPLLVGFVALAFAAAYAHAAAPTVVTVGRDAHRVERVDPEVVDMRTGAHAFHLDEPAR